MPTSQNGWSANDVSQTASYKIAGTSRALRLRKGPAGELLALLAAWIDANVESMDNEKIMDDWGYAERPIRGSSTTLSNHASGTAFDYNATKHPLGTSGNWSASAKSKINAKLNQLGGTVRWGENYSGRRDPMHFEINVRPTAAGLAAINRAVATMKGSVKPTVPAPGTGKPVDKPGDGIDMTVVAASIRYGANGGYFHSGQTTGPNSAGADIDVFLAWWLRLNRNVAAATKAKVERDVRVYRQMRANAAKTDKPADWKLAGQQLTGIIKSFQARYKLDVDGIFGPQCAAVMRHDNFVVIL
jgi:hypothetical protein